jgi:CRISPR-associated protein (TIGR03986 family)
MNNQYVGAPYNFIDFPSKWIERYASVDDLPPHDRYVEERLTGTIELTWQAESPVFVGGGKDKERFFQNHEGFAIPGSTVRGLIRSHVQILGMANWRDDIENERFLYRTFASKNSRLNDQYEARMGMTSTCKLQRQRKEKGRAFPEKLQAGYIVKTGKNQYKIYPALADDSGRQFYEIKESELRRMNPDRSLGIRYMYRVHSDRKQNLQRDVRYEPYICEVKYDMKADGRVNSIVPPDSTDPKKQKGYLLSSQWIEKKQTHYLIREMDESHPGIPVPVELVFSYERDLVRKKYKGNAKYAFYHLPEQLNKPKPVFYVHTDGQLYFGFTKYLRIFYDHTIHEGIPAHLREGWKLDYDKSLFGFISSKKDKVDRSYKGRLSFSDMQAVGNPRELPPVQMVLAGPKATAYSLYLKQPEAEQGKLMTYNDDGFELRGMKRYWLKTEVKPEKAKSDKVNVTIRPLDRGTRFTGTIRFVNLAPDELGLLLWAIMLNDGCDFNVGMGKPYGFGHMHLLRDSVKVTIENLEKKYNTKNLVFRDQYVETADPEQYIAIYKKYMKDQFDVDIDKEPHVQTFMAMSSYRLSPGRSRYMRIDKKEYDDLHPLPTVQDTIAGRTPKFIKPINR